MVGIKLLIDGITVTTASAVPAPARHLALGMGVA